MNPQSGRRIILPLIAALTLPIPWPARADGTMSGSTRLASAGLELPPFRQPQRIPVVVLVPDRLGRDGRERAYSDLLPAAGIAVLTLEVEEVEQAASVPDALRGILHRMAPDILDEERIGLLGLGWGGRAALAASRAMPTVALYPSCPGLRPVQSGSRILILHPDTPDEAAACLRISPHSEAIPGATHGWDHGQGPWAGSTAMLPHPDGSARRIFSRSDPWATEDVAARTLDFFQRAFATVMVSRKAP